MLMAKHLVIKRLMTKYVPGMLTCQEVDRFLYDFHQGNLSFSQQFKFKVHIFMCHECRTYVKEYKDTIRLSKEGFSIAQPIEKVPEDLMSAILKARKLSEPVVNMRKEHKD
jgi:predicted anti-sigma-YlaC factor YlaD